MKARVKATGKIIELCAFEYDEDGNEYYRDELELIGDYVPDYWEKLKHQYAGMAMQGILANNDLMEFLSDRNKDVALSKIIVDNADIAAVALINKLKEESKCEK